LGYELEIAIGGILSAIAAIAIAIFAIISARTTKTQTDLIKTQTDLNKTQTDIMKKEFLTGYRPWIGPDEGFVNDKIRLGLKFKYKNFGSTPALSVKERWGFTQDLPKREIILNVMSNISKPSVTLPDQKREFSFVLDESVVVNADKHKSSLYLWVIIDYEYGEKQYGQYGGVAEYVNKGKGIVRLEVQDEWVK